MKMAETQDLSASSSSLNVLLVLHLFPGILIFMAYMLLAEPLALRGLPPSFTLHLLFAGISIPYIYIFLTTRTKSSTEPGQGVIRFHQNLRVWQYLVLVPALLIYAVIISMLMAPVSTSLTNWLSGFAPVWFIESDYAPNGVAVPALLLLVVAILIDGLANPIAEELYFRGYLLPRLSKLGLIAPLLNGILFSLIHLWQPQNIPMLILLVVPLYYGVWYFRSVYLSIAVHCTANLLGIVLSTI